MHTVMNNGHLLNCPGEDQRAGYISVPPKRSGDKDITESPVNSGRNFIQVFLTSVVIRG